MTAAANVRVFNRFNDVIGEIYPEISSVAWRRNRYGLASFSLSPNDPKATREFLQFGNRVLIEFDNGLPAWGGVIDPPRRWELGKVTITAYGGEYLLRFRQTDRGRYFNAESVGGIAEALVVDANSIRATGLTAGDFWTGGDAHSPDYHFKNLYDIFTQSLFGRLSTADFEVVPSYNEGQIVFTLNVYERRGADKPGIALHEGFNVTDGTKFDEQGPIYNSAVAVGEGENWGADRPLEMATDQSSIDEFGLREIGTVKPGVSNPITLKADAETTVANSAQPHNLYTIVTVNKAPGTFDQYRVGDSVTAEIPSLGFGGLRGMVRVLGREFLPASGECPLIVRED